MNNLYPSLIDKITNQPINVPTTILSFLSATRATLENRLKRNYYMLNEINQPVLIKSFVVTNILQQMIYDQLVKISPRSISYRSNVWEKFEEKKLTFLFLLKNCDAGLVRDYFVFIIIYNHDFHTIRDFSAMVVLVHPRLGHHLHCYYLHFTRNQLLIGLGFHRRFLRILAAFAGCSLTYLVYYLHRQSSLFRPCRKSLHRS